MAKIKQIEIPSVGKDEEQLEFSYKISLWNTVWKFLIKLNLWVQPYDQIIPLLGIYHRKIETHVHTMNSMGMFIAALFIIAPNWKQPNIQQEEKC